MPRVKRGVVAHARHKKILDKAKGYRYFNKRLTEAPRDVINGLEITLGYYQTRAQQEQMLDVLQFKLDILWSMCDSMWMAYIEKKPPYHNCGE